MLLLLFSLCTSQFTELSFGKPGNTVGNIKNGGTAAEDEKYIYYAAYDGGLYKENKVDGAVKKIGGSIHGVGYLNVMGNNKKRLFAGDFSELSVDEEYIYYINNSEQQFYRASKENLDAECVTTERIRFTNISGEWIYFSSIDDDDALRRLSKGGRIKEKLIDSPVGETNVVGESVFYRLLERGWDRYKFSLSDGETEKLPD